jgi:NADH-quinone oxidoreductase subunit L
MIFLVLRPAGESEHHAHHEGHGHDSPWVMLAPMMVLATGAALAGFAGTALALQLEVEREHHSLAAMLPAVAIVLFGVAVAWWDFGRANAPRRGFILAVRPLYTLFRNQWYIDAFYNAVIVRITDAVATFFHAFENKGFDKGFDEVGNTVVKSGFQTARLQNGWVQMYIACVAVMLAVAAFYFGLK